MELLIVIAGIVLLWKFSTSINGIASATRAKTEVVAERIAGECIKERTDNFETFLKDMEGKKIYSHSEIFKYYRIDD